jgi:cell division septum initiation protein DivIVA
MNYEKRIQLHEMSIDDLYQCYNDLLNDNMELHRRIAELERYVKQLKQAITIIHEKGLTVPEVKQILETLNILDEFLGVKKQ